MTTEASVDYTIIIPVYYNEGSLEKTYDILKNEVVAKNLPRTAEIIFIDDGSGDRSFEVLKKIQASSEGLVKLIKLSRNFGQPHARNAGYDYSTGKCVIHLTADLQDPPELINQMLDYFFDEGVDIVICNRESRDESFYRTLTSKIFYGMMRRLSFPEMPNGGFDFHLISKRVKDTIRINDEANPFVQGQILWSGFEKRFISYKRRKREHGKSRWTFGKKLKLLLDGVLNYSYFPLRLMTSAGILISLIGFLYALWILFGNIFFNHQPQGYAPMMIVILILSGIQMLMLGVIGEYLWRALDEIRKRPTYIVEKIIK